MMKNMSNLAKKICLKIKMERIKRNWTQEELAFRAKLNINTVGKIERFETSPSIETLEKLSKVFAIKFEKLIDTTKVEL